MSLFEICARFVGLIVVFAGALGVLIYMIRTDKLKIPENDKKLLRWSFCGICAGITILGFLFQ